MLSRSLGGWNAEALSEFKQNVMVAQKTPVAEQSQKSALALACPATKKTGH